MRRQGNIAWIVRGRRLCIVALLLTWGCRLDGGSLLSRHFSQDRRAEAREQWASVRGGVKLRLAEQHLAAGRLDEAEQQLEQAVVVLPDSPHVYLLATRLRLEQGRVAKAREAITRAASLSGEDSEISYFAGIVAQRCGDTEGAMRHYAAARRRGPDGAAYLLAEAELLVALDRPAEAYALIASRTGDFGGNVPIRMLAARIARMLGLRAPVVEHCRDVLRTGEDDPVVAAEVGAMLVWGRRYAEGIALLRPLVDQHRADRGPSAGGETDGRGVVTPSVQHDLARAYLATRQWREAAWAVAPLVHGNEQDLVAWSLYVRAALMSGDRSVSGQADIMLRRQETPTPEVLLLDAYAALRRGDPRRAVDAAEAALRLDGRLVEAHCLIGQAAMAMGEEGRARQAYADAVALDPTSRIARSLLDTVEPAAVMGGDAGPTVMLNVGATLGARRTAGREGAGEP